jgi:CheY-like chemotaxis protein
LSMSLPAAQEAAEGRARSSRPQRGCKGAGETVLVVEDNPAVLSLTEALLSDLGYRVLCAGDGRDALKLLAGGEVVDLLFSDVVLPRGLSGPRLAEEARDHQPHLKVLLTTGFNELAKGGGSARRFALIEKPYDLDHLARKVRQVLDAPPDLR